MFNWIIINNYKYLNLVSKSILAATVIVVILFIGGGIYMMQQPTSTPTTTPTPTTPKPAATTPEEPTTAETPEQTTTPAPAKTPVEPLPYPELPEGTDEETIEALLLAYNDAFDRNSAAEVAGCFTEDGTYCHYWAFVTAVGREEIKNELERWYATYPDRSRYVSHEDLQLLITDINEDRAHVTMHYRLAGAREDVGIDEGLVLIKEDGLWRIQKTSMQFR